MREWRGEEEGKGRDGGGEGRGRTGKGKKRGGEWRGGTERRKGWEGREWQQFGPVLACGLINCPADRRTYHRRDHFIASPRSVSVTKTRGDTQ